MNNLIKAIFISVILSLSACESDVNIGTISTEDLCSDGSARIVGTGNIITEVLSPASFNSIQNLNGIDVSINRGPEQMVLATGHPNIIRKIENKVQDSTWTVILEEGCYSSFQLSIEVVLPTLKKVISKSSGNIEISGFDNMDELSIESMGSGDIRANPDMGAVKSLSVVNRGGGEIELYAVQADDCDIVSTGSGNSFVHAINNLEVTINGSGRTTSIDS